MQQDSNLYCELRWLQAGHSKECYISREPERGFATNDASRSLIRESTNVDNLKPKEKPDACFVGLGRAREEFLPQMSAMPMILDFEREGAAVMPKDRISWHPVPPWEVESSAW